MKVYVVMSAYIDREGNTRVGIEGIFSTVDKANAVAKIFDDEHIIERKNLWMVPEDIYDEYMEIVINHRGLKIESYKGFAPSAFENQTKRCELFDETWSRATIQEWEVE